MNKGSLVRSIVNLLKENDVKKPITIPRQVYTISDNEGNSKQFTVRKRDKREMFTINDVSSIVDALFCIIEDQVKQGNTVDIQGFGSFGVRYRKPRRIKNLAGEEQVIVGRYVPHFKFGNELRMCARVYGMNIGDKMPDVEPYYSDDDYIDDEVGDV